MDIQTKATTFVSYLKNLENFAVVDQHDGGYNHMGATIIDAILQAGTTYATVVRPRVDRIAAEFPEAKTTSAFKALIDSVGVKTLLNWKDDEKPNRVITLMEFLINEKIETEQALAEWLLTDGSREKLLELRGVGPKTADYLKILVGLQTAAVDRHVFRILEEASVEIDGYEEARDVLNLAADEMKVGRSLFDHSIWLFMSQREKESADSPD